MSNETFTLLDQEIFRVSDLNVLQHAVYLKSTSCLQYLLEVINLGCLQAMIAPPLSAFNSVQQSG